MPRSASWLGRMDEIEAQMKCAPSPLVDRFTVERLLGVSKRRAQQLMSGLPGQTIGTSGVVYREALMKRLREIADGEASEFEVSRRERVAQWIEDQARERMARPQLLVESPVSVINTRLEQLPEGVTVERGEVRVKADTGRAAVEKMLALCMAIGNDFDKFDQVLSGQ